MQILEKQFQVKDLSYMIRSAEEQDAKMLSEVRLQIDGETENLDRKRGEAYLDPQAFEQIIEADTKLSRNLFLVAERNGELIAYARCEGIYLSRFAHKVMFGICVRKAFWSYGIGTNLLQTAIDWADGIGIRKIELHVLETNKKAMILYEQFGFEVEGVLKNDRLLADGQFYATIVMGRFKK